jgi:hypothetical protein
MAVTHTAKTDAAGANPGYSLLTFAMTDGRHLPCSVSLRVIPTITPTQIDTIGAAIESISNAKICATTLTAYFDVTGGKAAASTAMYADKYTLARVRFASSANCREKVTVSVPAPLTAIFSGSGNVVLDITNALVTALSGSLVGILSSPEGDTAFALDGGNRDTLAMPSPTGI